MMDYTRRNSGISAEKNIDAGLRSYMLKVYNYMSMALMVTAITAYGTMNFAPLAKLMFSFNEFGQITGHSGLGMIVALSPIGIAFYFFSNATAIDISRSQTLLWVYAGLTGMSLASLGFIYTGESITKTFFVCSATFAAVSIYGYTTKRDLTSVGSFLVMGLIGLIVTSLLNMYFQSPAVYFATSLIGVAIFIGLIAYDTQKLKSIYYSVGGGEMGERMAIVGAFSLYLDFINLFIYLLRFLGTRRHD